MKLRLAGLHLQLLGLILLPFSLILLVVALLGVSVHQDAMRQLVAERDERSTRAAATAISQQLHHREFAIRGVAVWLLGPAPASEVIQQSDFLAADFDRGIAILDQSGAVTASSIQPDLWENRPVEEVRSSIQGSGAVFSSPFLDGEGMTVLVAAAGGERFAIGAFSVSQLIQTTLVTSAISGGTSSAFVTDEEGRLLQHVGERPEQDTLIDHPGVEAALRGEFGSFYRPAGDGEHVVAFSPIEPTRWALIIEEPWQSVSNPRLDVSFAAPLSLIPAFVLTLIGLWFGANQVIRPLRELQDRAESMALMEGETLGETVGGIAEIRQLQHTLDRMAMRVRESRRALQGYISAITHAQEEERRRLARELHDETIQDLIAIDQQIQMLATDLRQQNVGHAERLEELHRDVNRAVGDVRRITRALRPSYLEDLGLAPAVEMLADDLGRAHPLQVEYRLEGEEVRQRPQVELSIYRIVQEALSNIARHADAASVLVRLSFSGEGIQAEVQDDGRGFELPEQPADFAAQGHFGLMGMHERAELIGAQLDIRSNPGKGTRVLVQFPAQD